MPLGVEVLIDQETLRRMVLSSLDYYTHHKSPHTIPPKMTMLRHNAGQEGRGEILLENSFLR